MTIFDLDGTLIDITERWYRLHVACATECGMRPLERSSYISKKREGIGEREIMQEEGVDPDQLERYLSRRLERIEEREFLKYDRVVPEVQRLLRAWRARGALVLITRRKDERLCMEQLRRLKLDSYFDRIYVTGGKEKIEILQSDPYILERLPGAIFISDSLEDRDAALELGIEPIIVGYGCRTTDYFARHGVTDILEKTDELGEVMGRMPRKVRIAIDSTYMDRRPAKGTAIVIRDNVTEVLRHTDMFELTLIHREPIPEDPIYSRAREIIILRIPLPKFANFFSELWFFLTTHERFDVYYFSYSRLYPTFWLAPARRIVWNAGDGGPQTAGFTGQAKGRAPWYVRIFLSRVHTIVAISDFGRNGIMRTYGLDQERVSVVYDGIHPRFFEPIADTDVSAALARYGIRAPYILDVSRFDPHKNILNLLDAYAALRAAGKVTHQLVFVGGRHMPEYSDTVERRIAELGLEKDVYIAPFIIDEDMPAVYRGADCMVFPSLYEGFGLPVIEAMASGTPVIISDIDALVEVAGGAAHIVDPHDIESISRGMASVLQDAAYSGELTRKGHERAKHFTREAHGEALVSVLRNAAPEAS